MERDISFHSQLSRVEQHLNYEADMNWHVTFKYRERYKTGIKTSTSSVCLSVCQASPFTSLLR